MTSIAKKKLEKNVFVEMKIIDGPDRGQSFKIFYDKTKVGRRRADIILTDPKVSGTHFLLEYKKESDDFSVTDLNSTNGTFLNNLQVNESVLKDGDILKVGSTSIIFEIRKVGGIGHPNLNDIIAEKTKAQKPGFSGIKKVIDEELGELKTKKVHINEIQKPVQDELKLQNVSLFLQVIEGHDKGKKFEIKKGSIFIGRLNTDIVIQDNDISRRHMLIETFGKDQIFIRDLASTNGTFVNDKKIVNSKISNSDIIKIGNTILKLIVLEK